MSWEILCLTYKCFSLWWQLCWPIARGTSNNNMTAFMETYSELHKLRSLASSVKMIALTATATSSTRKAITEIMIQFPYLIYENHGNLNIAYSVHYMEKDKSVEDYFQWLADEIKQIKAKATRTIIYCQTIKTMWHALLNHQRNAWWQFLCWQELWTQKKLSLTWSWQNLTCLRSKHCCFSWKMWRFV